MNKLDIGKLPGRKGVYLYYVSEEWEGKCCTLTPIAKFVSKEAAKFFSELAPEDQVIKLKELI